MIDRKTFLFNNQTVRSLLSLEETIKVVEAVFMAYNKGHVQEPDLMHFDANSGEFHIKGACLLSPKAYFGLKSNGGFFKNMDKNGLPNIQGLILLHDGDTGSPLAVFESGEITIQRTGALTAVAAKYLARKDSEIATICGCGTQGRIQLRALLKVCMVKRIIAYDTDQNAARAFVREMTEFTGMEIVASHSIEEATRDSDIIITCTPSRKHFIRKDMVKEGTFIAAVGSDSPGKQELDPRLIADSKLVVDIARQCLEVGDSHHAVAGGFMKPEDIFAEMKEIIGGRMPGREGDTETIVFDATGSGLQDVAVAAHVYEAGLMAGDVPFFRFWD